MKSKMNLSFILKKVLPLIIVTHNLEIVKDVYLLL
jgi:hypothetical protein